MTNTDIDLVTRRIAPRPSGQASLANPVSHSMSWFVTTATSQGIPVESAVSGFLRELHLFLSFVILLPDSYLCPLYFTVSYIYRERANFGFHFYLYCDVLPVNTSNNLVGCGFCISIYWILHQRSLQSLITLPITSREPATSSGSSSSPSWRKPLLRIFRDELLVMNSYSRLPWSTAMTRLL
jgi:hypothetical protein